MVAVTLRSDGSPVGQKAFAWSYSKLKNYEICPKRHYEIDILKTAPEEVSDALTWGDRVHKTAAEYFSKGTPLPDDVKVLMPWVKKLERNPPHTILVERKYALTRELLPCGYFDKEVWFRGVADVLKLQDDVALAVDWKTGKILPDSVQLALMAACVLAHHPQIKVVRTEFIWLGDDATTSEYFTRQDTAMMWVRLFPRVELMQNSHQTSEYPATPNGLCAAYCPVTKCIHHGKKYRKH